LMTILAVLRMLARPFLEAAFRTCRVGNVHFILLF
jgi:hypothetical protein